MDKVSIFAEALLKTTLEERRMFLAGACGGDIELRTEINALLAAHDDAGSFLQKTPEELASTSGIDVHATAADDDAWKSFLKPSKTPHCLGTLGQYEVAELLGRGGMGVVLRARDPKLNRVVAIKMLAPELAVDPVSVQRFLREAQAAAAVTHDHVVTIHAVDEDTRPPTIVMEFIDGQSLQQKIDSVGTLDVKSILRIGRQTAAGLAAAHRQGLVHRDVKPANILLENSIERVKLTDFGLARAIDDISMTKTGTITGTPQYMSPEQAQGETIDHRTDLFSLGCVLYAMCTGRAAFRADSAVAVMHCVVHQTPRPIGESNEDIPGWLCEIVDKLLAKKPDDRFASATEVETLLSQHLAHLQQPDSVPQPKRLTPPGNFGQNIASETENRLPGWFFIKIRAWMIMLVGNVVFLAMQTNPNRILGVYAWVAVGLFSAALSTFLRHKEREATKQGILYSGYTSVFAIGIVLSFEVPVLLMHGSSAVLLGIVTALTVAAVLHYVRTQSYTTLREMEIDQPYPGWTIVDDFYSRKLNLLAWLFLTFFVFLPLTISTGGPELSIEDRVRTACESLLVSVLAAILLWWILRRKLASDTEKQNGSRTPKTESIHASVGRYLIQGSLFAIAAPLLLIATGPVIHNGDVMEFGGMCLVITIPGGLIAIGLGYVLRYIVNKTQCQNRPLNLTAPLLLALLVAVLGAGFKYLEEYDSRTLRDIQIEADERVDRRKLEAMQAEQSSKQAND